MSTLCSTRNGMPTAGQMRSNVWLSSSPSKGRDCYSFDTDNADRLHMKSQLTERTSVVPKHAQRDTARLVLQ